MEWAYQRPKTLGSLKDQFEVGDHEFIMILLIYSALGPFLRMLYCSNKCKTDIL